MIDVSIIIVSYNVRHFLEQCLRSVYASKGQLELEIFVVDNASSDNTLGFLREQFPRAEHPELHLVNNVRNVGFGRANNQALAHAKGRYVLFLNPDTVLTEHTLTDCVTFADSHADMGALGVMQLHSNGEFALESRHGIPTPWRAFCQMSGLSSLFPATKTFDGYHMRFFDNAAAAPIEIASGAFMLIPRDALEEIGGFDERFFMYCEDVDLCYRLLQSGRQNYYLPTPILHYKGASTRRGSFRYVHTFYSAMLIFFNKHYAKSARLMSPLIRLGIYLRGLISYAGKKLLALRHFHAPRLGTRAERQVYFGRHTSEVKA
ncbi:MAG: glycosyltransferase family 2 protein, partial [Prevotellamassilia sp.]|nr:glycosyltransferase family 2 protein [Prevotellamassilia sp.]